MLLKDLDQARFIPARFIRHVLVVKPLGQTMTENTIHKPLRFMGEQHIAL